MYYALVSKHILEIKTKLLRINQSLLQWENKVASDHRVLQAKHQGGTQSVMDEEPDQDIIQNQKI